MHVHWGGVVGKGEGTTEVAKGFNWVDIVCLGLQTFVIHSHG